MVYSINFKKASEDIVGREATGRNEIREVVRGRGMVRTFIVYLKIIESFWRVCARHDFCFKRITDDMGKRLQG